MYKAENEKAILTVVRDDFPINPRGWDNLGTMVCWPSRYDLGDKHNFEDKDHFLFCLLEEMLGDIGLAENKYEELKDNGDKEILSFLGDEYVILPLFIYDLSGVTISTSSFNCSWDSGQVGWIYTPKKSLITETGYSYTELFSSEKHRLPKVGEHVKIKGHEDSGYKGFGKIKSIISDQIVVDFDYIKPLPYRKEENIMYCALADVTEVMCNKAVKMLVEEVEEYNNYLIGDVYRFKLEKKVYRQPCDPFLSCAQCGGDCPEFEVEEIDSCGDFYGTVWERNGLIDYVGTEYSDLVGQLKWH